MSRNSLQDHLSVYNKQNGDWGIILFMEGKMSADGREKRMHGILKARDQRDAPGKP